MNKSGHPPERYSQAWFNAKYTAWQRQSRSLKWIELVGFTLTLTVLFQYFWKAAWGYIYYFLAYFRTALYYHITSEPCFRVMRETNPWRSLDNELYWRRMTCEGTEDGMRKQGNLIPTVEEIMGWLFNPYAFSSWVAMLFLIYLRRPVWNKVTWIIGYVMNHVEYFWGHHLPNVWRYHTWSLGVLWIFTIWAFANWFIALISAIIIYYAPWQTMGQRIGFAFAVRTDPTPKVPNVPKDSIPNQLSSCIHVTACQCYTQWQQDIDIWEYRLASTEYNHRSTEIELSKTNSELERVHAQLDNARRLANSANNASNSQPAGRMPTLGALTVTTPYDRDRLLADYEYARNRISSLEQDKDHLIQEKNRTISRYEAEFAKLKQQLDYNRGVGNNMFIAVSEADTLKAKVRTLQRENKALIEAGMQTRQALAKEREIHSEKCQDEARCQMKISALEFKCKQLLNSHAYNDKMVVDAAIKFGVPKEEAVHIDLMAYLQSVTIEVARLKALGVQGMGATNTIDFTIRQLQEELKRITALKNRMEREVDRLGGNVIGIRNGWDTTRPKEWAIDLDTTYEQNADRMFPIYEALCQTFFGLEMIYVDANVAVPVWEPEKSRNHQTFGAGFVATPQNILEAGKLANRMIHGSEELTQKLTVTEVQRLYNRAQELAIRMKELSAKEQLPNGEVVVQNPVVRESLQMADRVFKKVLIEILDDRRPVVATPTERAPDARLQKKFEIYIAMQEAIQALTNSIVANSHLPPDWIQDFRQQSKPWSSPDNLALNLMNAEMRTLEVRIKQLLQCMTELKLPGTLYGSRMTVGHADPEFNARWYELVSSTTYAELVLSHLRLHFDQKLVQIEDAKTGKKKMVTIPVANILPLTTKDQYFRDAMNRGESEKEKAARQLKEGKWPHPDMIQAVIIDNIPGVAPRVEFKYIDPNAKVEDRKTKNTDGNKNYMQDENNSNSADSNGNNDYEKAKKHWETKKQRVQQLKNHIQHWNIGGNNQLPKPPSSLKKNMGTEDVKRANNTMDGHINMMTGIITQKGYKVPKMMYKGGNLFPN